MTTFVEVGKDWVTLLRDFALLVLAVLLIVFPSQFNSILVNAGFEEGSVVGFKWKSKLVESDNALKEARATIAELQGKNDELLKRLGETAVKLPDAVALQSIEKLKDENLRVKTATQQVQARVAQTIESNAPLVEKALASPERRGSSATPKSDYNVGLQTVGVSDTERESINEKLRADGYGLDPTTYSYASDQRPSWFADRSTVFYYSAAGFTPAQELARFMKSATGREFNVRRGAGLGVDPARRDVTFYIHYLKS